VERGDGGMWFEPAETCCSHCFVNASLQLLQARYVVERGDGGLWFEPAETCCSHCFVNASLQLLQARYVVERGDGGLWFEPAETCCSHCFVDASLQLLQARYVVERGDGELWLKVLDESNADRRSLIDQVSVPAVRSDRCQIRSLSDQIAVTAKHKTQRISSHTDTAVLLDCVPFGLAKLCAQCCEVEELIAMHMSVCVFICVLAQVQGDSAALPPLLWSLYQPFSSACGKLACVNCTTCCFLMRSALLCRITRESPENIYSI